MADVFISYIEEDRELALEISKGLENAEYTTLCFGRDLVTGVVHNDKAGKALEESEVILVLMSPDSVLSHQIEKEVMYSKELGKTSIIVLNGLSQEDYIQKKQIWQYTFSDTLIANITPSTISECITNILGFMKVHEIYPEKRTAIHQQDNEIDKPLGRKRARREPRDIFISYAEEDAEIAIDAAKGLENVGYTTWLYKRDSLPGTSYLIQTSWAIDDCKAVILLISESSIESRQVSGEIEQAYECDKEFIPILIGINHDCFIQKQPLWRRRMRRHNGCF